MPSIGNLQLNSPMNYHVKVDIFTFHDPLTLTMIVHVRPLCILSSFPAATAYVEKVMKNADVLTMASGNLPDGSGMKFFFYAQEIDSDERDILDGAGDSNRAFYLIQLIMSNSGEVTVVIKTSSLNITHAQNSIPERLLQALSSFEGTITKL